MPLDVKKPVCIITGPTACGKTALSYEIARAFPCEIINADVGQLYTPLSVGTAKPLWRSAPFVHHLFDILDRSVDYTVTNYRSAVLKAVQEIDQKGELSLIVGGSLFYINGLFFPPHDIAENSKEGVREEKSYKKYSIEELWEQLSEIDEKRAQQIHPHDRYRIERALDIWNTTGRKPSDLAPLFDCPFRSLFIFILSPKEVLMSRIEQRIKETIIPWIAEVEGLVGSEWEKFLVSKNILGYPELIQWVKEGKQERARAGVIKIIEQQTWRYARRQMIFLKKLQRELQENQETCSMRFITIEEASSVNIEMIKKEITQLIKL